MFLITFDWGRYSLFLVPWFLLVCAPLPFSMHLFPLLKLLVAIALLSCGFLLCPYYALEPWHVCKFVRCISISASYRRVTATGENDIRMLLLTSIRSVQHDPKWNVKKVTILKCNHESKPHFPTNLGGHYTLRKR